MNKTTIEIIVLLHVYFQDSQKIAAWLKLSNPLLGGIKPITMIQTGREKKLLKFIENNIEGHMA